MPATSSAGRFCRLTVGPTLWSAAVALRAFGLTLAPSLPLPGAWSPVEGRHVDLELVGATRAELARDYSGGDLDGWQGTPDGRRMLITLGTDGDALVRLDGEPAFHLGDRRLACDMPDGDTTSRRVLLDSVLLTASVLAGYEVLHAGAVLGRDGAVALVADTGGGKSTLVTQLVAAGAGFVTDDILALSDDGDGAVAHAGPPFLTRPGPPAQAIGEPIAVVGNETWCTLPVAVHETPLAAVVFLERAPALPLGLERLAASPLPVVRHLLPFPQRPERALSRFELAGTVAQSAGLYRLTASLDEPPYALMEQLSPLL